VRVRESIADRPDAGCCSAVRGVAITAAATHSNAPTSPTIAQRRLSRLSDRRDLFAAAVGIPGLPLQQYIVDRLYADGRYLAASLESACRQALSDVRDKRIKRLTLKRFEAGAAPPKLLAARAYDAPDVRTNAAPRTCARSPRAARTRARLRIVKPHTHAHTHSQ
jgi:hypothetical protein